MGSSSCIDTANESISFCFAKSSFTITCYMQITFCLWVRSVNEYIVSINCRCKSSKRQEKWRNTLKLSICVWTEESSRRGPSTGVELTLFDIWWYHSCSAANRGCTCESTGCSRSSLDQRDSTDSFTDFHRSSSPLNCDLNTPESEGNSFSANWLPTWPSWQIVEDFSRQSFRNNFCSSIWVRTTGRSQET